MFTQIFDTHSHYTDSAFDADRHEVLSALPEAGIVHAVLAGTTLEDSTAGIAPVSYTHLTLPTTLW